MPFKKGHKINLGRKFPKSFGEKISRSKKGVKFTKNHIEALRKSRLGFKMPEETKKKISLALKGRPGRKWTAEERARPGRKWTKKSKEKMRKARLGKKHSEETKKKIGAANSREKHWNWKGDEVGYDALHRWVYKEKGRPVSCEHCGESKRLEWSNISGDYKRDARDYEALCVKCHHVKDGVYEKMWITRRKNVKRREDKSYKIR